MLVFRFKFKLGGYFPFCAVAHSLVGREAAEACVAFPEFPVWGVCQLCISSVHHYEG